MQAVNVGSGSLTVASPAKAKPLPKASPAFWWAGMAEPSLQILLRGEGVGKSEVSISATDIQIDSIVRPANDSYLLLYINIGAAGAQTFDITLTVDGKTQTLPYELRARENRMLGTFDATDVVYLLMPDRFANGNPDNDVVPGLLEAVSSQEPFDRHGGDLAGMKAQLPYLEDLGITAIWPTPVMVNDMPKESYHGYAITDYYLVDPRFGTNEDYQDFVAAAHSHGIKVIQDMVFNHCGAQNVLFTDLPDSTWFNNNSTYVQTSYKISAVGDPHASTTDADNSTDGWFVAVMPDLNQRNPHVMTYLIQTSIFWIEYAGIDGIRQDTYPYADRKAMARWCQAVRKEYPGFNIVGETWINNNVGVSYWQTGSPVAPNDDSCLPTVMDFPLWGILNSATGEETNDWDRGLARVYDYLSQDAVYADPNNLLTFLSNHDTQRFSPNEEATHNITRYKQALTLLLTVRGIPQLYYGDEIAMYADKSQGDGFMRQNFPGADGTANLFTGEGLTSLQKETLDFTRKLLRWRKGNDVVGKGEFRHFAVRNGVYVYARILGDKIVTVLMNGNDKTAELPLTPYAEVLPKAEAHDVISGESVQLGETIELAPRAILLLEF